MPVPRRHLRHQGPLIRTLVATAGRVAMRRLTGGPKGPVQTPTPTLVDTVPPRDPELIADYLRWAGGDRRAYGETVPAHLFPQWGFPLLAETLGQVPYDLSKALNGGCRIEMNRPLPAGEPLILEACLEEIDDNGRRAVLRQKLVTGTASAPGAVTSWLYAIVPLSKGDGAKKERPRVPEDLPEIGRARLGPDAGYDFALLTGDFNPIHWIPAAARAAGFKNTILHGFGTLALAIEAINKVILAQDVRRLKTIDVQFTRPLVLPAKPGIFADHQGRLAVGEAPSGPAYLTGQFTLTETSS